MSTTRKLSIWESRLINRVWIYRHGKAITNVNEMYSVSFGGFFVYFVLILICFIQAKNLSN